MSILQQFLTCYALQFCSGNRVYCPLLQDQNEQAGAVVRAESKELQQVPIDFITC